jgi:methionine synthase II (cobalamin-independent)
MGARSHAVRADRSRPQAEEDMTASRNPHSSGAVSRGRSRPCGVHLVGSIPLENAETVFRAVGPTLGGHIRRIPDGETGKRRRWNSWTAPSYERTRGLELVDPPEGSYTPWKQARLVIDPSELVLERLGFADAAIASYADFTRCKAEGVLPQRVRFQVCLPSPIAPMTILIEHGSAAAVEPAHIRQLHAEIDEILAAIPHDELAIQWDVCQDVGIWEGFYPAYFEDPEEGVIERLTVCAHKIPQDVQVGFHLCYGDFQHKHFMDPKDLGVGTEIANRLTKSTTRTIDWIHMPVPIDRDDAAYFAPLERLSLARETELYLGVIHSADGVQGAERRIQSARQVVDGFGVATECGFGRRPPETISDLLRLHAEIASPFEVDA